MNETIFYYGEVKDNTDPNNGGRLKVKLVEDGTKSVDELPYAFPLLPKTLNVVPKIGECVAVFTMKLGNSGSQRMYIGPIISQPQLFEHDYYNGGNGTSLSCMDKNKVKPMYDIRMKDETQGAFPEQNDISIIGRKSEDITLKDGEIDLRCGIRKPLTDRNKNDDYIGNIAYNNSDPAYIQLKHKEGIGKGNGFDANSMINVVADKINLLGHNRNANTIQKTDTFFNLTDKKELITDEELEKIKNNAHEAVFGDVLVEILQKIIDILRDHVHSYPGINSNKEYVTELNKINLESILSKNIRIN
jgi:hypothetical protein